MEENLNELIAKQLRRPDGEMGKQVGERMNEGNKFMNLYTLEKLNAAPGEKILEIGMGNGHFVKNILSVSETIQYYGCDFSETMVNEATERNKGYVEKGQANFMLAFAHNLPFTGSTFDKVFAINTLYFWEDPEKELSEIKRVLKTNGQFFLTIRPKEVMETYPFVQYGFNMYSKEELVQLITKNGFHVIEIEEKAEPEMEFNGQILEVKSLYLTAKNRA